MSVERSVLEKLASNAFTDEERGYLVEMLLAKQAEGCPEHGAHCPPFCKHRAHEGDEGKKEEKKEEKCEGKEKESAYVGVNFDEEAIVKEASALSDEDLAAAIEAAATGLSEPEQDAIVKAAYDDVVGELTMRKQAMEYGYWMFQGFDVAAQEKQAAEQSQQVAEGLAQKAPHLVAALQGR